ncbi:MAG TPA: hypothetical protein VMW72_26195, partial [Sedimentisphaerales bacterium]|nr:hypothetical protein [Sedimentisphaerales bacterium]
TTGTGTTTLKGDVTTTAAAGLDISNNAIVLDGLNVVTTNSGIVRFNGPTDLTTAATDIDADGTITFANTLTSSSGSGLGLTLESDADIDFDNTVGAGANNELGAILIDTAVNVEADSTIETASLVQAAGTGITTLHDDVTAAVEIELNSNTTVADGKTIKAGNDLKMGAGKTLTGEGDLILEATAGGITEIGGDNKVQIKMAADDKTLTLNQNDSIDMTNFYVTNKSDVTDLSATDLVANSTVGSVSVVSGDDNPADKWKSITATADSGITLQGIGNITTNALTSTNGNIDIKSKTAVALNGLVTTQNGGGVTVTAQSDVTTQKPITTEALSVTTNSNIEIRSYSGDLNINDNLTAKGGGVKLVADDGNIYLSGASLNIIGTSDGTTGVTLPAGIGKAAIVIWSKLKDLNLGSNATLTANGSYDDSVFDDRASVSFLPPPPNTVEAGEPIDIAIYLGSFNHSVPGAGGDLTVDSTVSMAANGTMVIDAYDTVHAFGSNFTGSAPWSVITNRLEVVSRQSPTLDYAAQYDTLPHADEARLDMAPPWFGGKTYILRGLKLLAKVLAKIEPVPLVLPKPLAPEDQGQVQIERRDAEVLGLGDKPELARAYQPSLNTDLNLDKAAQILYVLMPILRDSSRIAILDRIVVEIWQDVDQPIAPEQEAMIAQRIAGTPAEEWVAALTEYVDVMSTMVGRPKTASVLWVMQTYVIPQAEEGLLQDQTVAFLEAQID